jgi:hypothetical protein
VCKNNEVKVNSVIFQQSAVLQLLFKEQYNMATDNPVKSACRIKIFFFTRSRLAAKGFSEVTHLLFHSGNVRNQIDNTATVTPLVIVPILQHKKLYIFFFFLLPSNELHKLVVERDSGVRIKHAAVRVVNKICRHNFLVRVRHNPLKKN